MALKLTLKPGERIVVNGCAMRNTDRRHVLVIESHADVIRGHDLLDESDAATPVARAYYLIQTALTRADLREKLIPAIQSDLARLVTVFADSDPVFEAANHVSTGDYYKALVALRPLRKREETLLDFGASDPAALAEARP